MVIRERRPGGLKERLDSTQLRAARNRVFRERISTLDEEAEPYSLDDLRLALGVIRVGMRSEMEWLSDRAFEQQPAGSNGKDVWSAGQVVNHVAHAQIGMTSWLQEALVVEPSPDPHPLTDLTDASAPGLLSREQALHALDVADRELEALFDRVPEQIEPSARASHPVFGDAGIKGGLLVMAIHEDSHLEQLIDLRF